MNAQYAEELSDEKLKDYLNGTACEIGSKAYLIALQEKEKRGQSKKDEHFIRLIGVLDKLAENWQSKLFWLLFIASVSGIIINVASAFLVKFLGIN